MILPPITVSYNYIVVCNNNIIYSIVQLFNFIDFFKSSFVNIKGFKRSVFDAHVICLYVL
nr:hypothetical protein CJLB15_00097 [Campylobacter phage CJLB-15]